MGTGTITTGEIVRNYPQQDPSFHTVLALTGTSTITPVACSVNTTVINVNLDDADASDFKGVGSTAKPKDFNIGLNCDAGTNVKLTLEGNGAGPDGVLSINTGPNQASGIGIQVLKGTTPVVLGKQLGLGTAGKTGDIELPLVAQYYQTEAPIVAGLTNATATFTMAYN
ncbi:fimbrial protein [Ewingella americana]